MRISDLHKRLLVDVQLLLDIYPNAVSAYSLRKLRSDYNGECIRVRRSSDDTEQDIGFVNNDLNVTELLNFVDSNDGFVTVWYDQSGFENDASQTDHALQPTIVDDGNLQTLNGNPALYAPVDKALVAPAISGVQTGNTAISVFQFVQATQFIPPVGGFTTLMPAVADTDRRHYGVPVPDSSTATSLRLIGGNVIWNYNLSDISIFSSVYKGDSNPSTARANGSQLTQSSATPDQDLNIQSDSGIVLFAGGGGTSTYNDLDNYKRGYLSESVFYFSDQTENQEGIESNINRHYNVF